MGPAANRNPAPGRRGATLPPWLLQPGVRAVEGLSRTKWAAPAVAGGLAPAGFTLANPDLITAPYALGGIGLMTVLSAYFAAAGGWLRNGGVASEIEFRNSLMAHLVRGELRELMRILVKGAREEVTEDELNRPLGSCQRVACDAAAWLASCELMIEHQSVWCAWYRCEHDGRFRRSAQSESPRVTIPVELPAKAGKKRTGYLGLPGSPYTLSTASDGSAYARIYGKNSDYGASRQFPVWLDQETLIGFLDIHTPKGKLTPADLARDLYAPGHLAGLFDLFRRWTCNDDATLF